MKIIKKSTMSDATQKKHATKIQIEDWTQDYPGIYKCYSIAAYPISKENSEYGFIRRNHTFRLGLEHFSSNEEVFDVFERLENGTLALEDLSDHYANPDDAYYIGIA